MTRTIRYSALGLAIAVNGTALVAMDMAMGQIAAREKLALLQPARIVVVGQRTGEPVVATQTCPAPTVL